MDNWQRLPTWAAAVLAAVPVLRLRDPARMAGPGRRWVPIPLLALVRSVGGGADCSLADRGSCPHAARSRWLARSGSAAGGSDKVDAMWCLGVEPCRAARGPDFSDTVIVAVLLMSKSSKSRNFGP